jgi:anti-sigma regulatory factor (Ser/Thr protein kinase)
VSGEHPGLELRLHATPVAATELRRALRDWLAAAGASEQEAFDVTLACSEAFANAIGHPLRPATLIVDVEATVNQGRMLTLVVRDYALARPERSLDETRMFLRLMETLMESAEAHARPDGVTLVLRRRLGPGRFAAGAHAARQAGTGRSEPARLNTGVRSRGSPSSWRRTPRP